MEEQFDGWTDGHIQKQTAGENLDLLFRTVDFFAINTNLPKLSKVQSDYYWFKSLILSLLSYPGICYLGYIQATFLFIHHFSFWT